MEERLRLYQKRNRTLPSRIIVYRDGVSEGQFNDVLSDEYPKMVEAFDTFGNPKQPYRPKLTIVICGKRHHTRFFPTDSRFADQNGNPKPGTVVDRGVTAVYGECTFGRDSHRRETNGQPTQISISTSRRTMLFKARFAPRTITSSTMRLGSRRTNSRLSPTRSLTCSLVQPKPSLSPPQRTMLILHANVGAHTCTRFYMAYRMVVRLAQAERRVTRNRRRPYSRRRRGCGAVVPEARSKIRCFICDPLLSFPHDPPQSSLLLPPETFQTWVFFFPSHSIM